MTPKVMCLRCQEEMSFFAREQLQLGKAGWLLGDLPNLISGALKVDIYICPNCQKLEFFAVEGNSQAEDVLKKTCPSCGTIHDFDYPKCPRCKYDYYSK